VRRTRFRNAIAKKVAAIYQAHLNTHARTKTPPKPLGVYGIHSCRNSSSVCGKKKGPLMIKTSP